MKKELLRTADFVRRWILLPALYIFLVTIGGLIVVSIIDGLSDHSFLRDVPYWLQLLVGFIVGFVVWAIWKGGDYKSPDRGAGR
ncbi:hypothetical protein RAAC3_TM7C00001G0360 [Candidatus Saccharibacteria bacterium RAAC3_TM7_1]|nr:hypothetical protein RAAC3_TM7C00001G0360 [Candidatus Saccharibacteria bacterium RAAC3_TM7_1]